MKKAIIPVPLSSVADTVKVLDYLMSIDRAIGETYDVAEALQLKDRAEAVRFLTNKVGLDKAIQNRAAASCIRSQAKLGELLLATEKNKGGNPNLLQTAIGSPTYDELNIEPTAAHRWQTIAKVPEERREKFITTALNDGHELTIGGMYSYARNVLKMKTLGSSEDTSWYTPSEYIEAARKVLGNIDVDPASSEIANQTVRADTYYTVDTDGLIQEWHGKVWLNPPYGEHCHEFIERLLDQYALGHTTEAIVLLNAHITETKWFAPLWDFTLCFTKGRINFYRPTGEQGDGSNHGSLFVYIGVNKGSFIEEFKKFGPVVKRIDQ